MKHTPVLQTVITAVSPEYREEKERNIFSDNYEGDQGVTIISIARPWKY